MVPRQCQWAFHYVQSLQVKQLLKSGANFRVTPTILKPLSSQFGNLSLGGLLTDFIISLTLSVSVSITSVMAWVVVARILSNGVLGARRNVVHLLRGIRIRKYHKAEGEVPVAAAFEDNHRCSPSPRTFVVAERRTEQAVRPGPVERTCLAAGDSPALERGRGHRGYSLAVAWPGGLGGRPVAGRAGGSGPFRVQHQGLRSVRVGLGPSLHERLLHGARCQLGNQTYLTLPVPMQYPTSEVSGACSPLHVSRRAW